LKTTFDLSWQTLAKVIFALATRLALAATLALPHGDRWLPRLCDAFPDRHLSVIRFSDLRTILASVLLPRPKGIVEFRHLTLPIK